ncbi:ATP-binding cassette sub-family G member 1-like [Cylas formicarius]|uniref:ATP-binding cassette sub-family G member 1-like n=1 Tax=Cylas formicarius TaxID=197179 RepID=UPI002958DDCC|nr:ATP-binding cassette sub-family G member 1-like [Cylas formicarius]
MSNKEDKNKSSGSALKCCQSNESFGSNDSSENDVLCEVKNSCVGLPKLNVSDVAMVKDTVQYKFPKKQQVDLEFDNVYFRSSSWSLRKFQKETKTILHGVSGKFKSGELSVIMGPSGAGKSTLLNILAGFVTRGSTGKVTLNGMQRDNSPRFRKLSAYIPQEEELRLALTVKEAMTFAANLKLGYSVSHQYKAQQVVEILELLGLDQCHHTLTSRLSGGQRKRLAVALELLSNPPILFLDEPTTGLDSSSCSHCISLFKRLAQEGRTIICTIHQPSALLFEMFDKLYALADGKCIYDGPTSSLVPYLDKFGLKCPPYHNPADFLMEVAIGEHGTDLNVLADASKEIQEHSSVVCSKEQESLLNCSGKGAVDLMSAEEPFTSPAPVIMQFFLLYKRSLLAAKRNYMYSVNRLLAHVLIGFIFGYLYKGVGANANQILANYVYLYGTMLLIVYTGKMSVTLSFPLEMRILTREHFNRWYNLTPYLLSIVLIEIPFQVICTWIYIVISYWLTDQPVDFRVYLFVLFCTLGTLCAQSMGYFIGATTPTKIAVFIGPVIACLFSIFGFCIRLYDTPLVFRWLFAISYFRAAFQGIVYSVYGLNRGKLFCPEDEVYCHYEDPNKFLKEMDIMNVDLVSNISLVVFIWCLMHAATYLTLWFKLNKR